MAQKTETQGNLANVMRGMREVAKVTFTKKPIETDFTPQTPDTTKKPDPTPTDTQIPLRKISGSNELIVAPEYMPDLTKFFNEHSVADSISVPCYFNNDSCDLVLCVFPRVMRPVESAAFVKDIVAMNIYPATGDAEFRGMPVGTAEYSLTNPNALREFKQDIESLTPAYYRNNQTEQRSLRDALMAKFPGLVVPHENISLENDAPGKEPTTHAL